MKSRTIEHRAAIGFERKNSLKDDLPDLTPYLSKKGGNSQGKAADNSGGKTDISSKLSALVKKTGTLSGSDADVIVDSQSSMAQQAEPVPSSAPSPLSSSSGVANSASADTSGANSATNSSSWEQVDSFSSSANAARLEAQAEALAQEKMFAQAAAGIIPEPDFPALTNDISVSDSAISNSREVNQSAPSVVATESYGQASSSSSQPESFSTSGNFSTSGTFATRPMASRPGSSPAIDKFKAPQARPMNTLSSGAPPLLKAPEKEAVRSPAPYTFQQANEAPREAVVPKSMQLPTPAAPTSSAPGSSAQAKRAAEIAKEPPPSWPAQPTSPPRIVEKMEKMEKMERKVESQHQPPSQPQAQYQSPPQPSLSQQAPIESTAEILAKAFMEEARALEQNSDDMLEPSSSMQNNFSSEADSQFDSPYFEPKPKGSVGFGSLLNAGSTAPDFAANNEPVEHSSLADLMIPTGEHQALFAPERRGDDGISPFDEVQPGGQTDNSHNSATSSAFVADQADAASESVRVDERSAAPAFSSLFSTEIVTSGQDFSFRDDKPSDFGSGLEEPSNQYSLASEEPVTQSSGVLSQSDAISKLLEAVNKEQQSNVNHDLANNFANQSYSEANFSEPEDMRTADTMFGSGGSNKGSAEELSAADAVFGAVPDLVAPAPESPLSPGPSANSASSSSLSSSSFPEQPALGKDSLPIAFANAENFEQESLESIKLGIRKAKAEEKARKKAEEEAKLAEARLAESQFAEAANAAPSAVEEPLSRREEAAEPIKSSEQQSPKSTAKLSLTEMIELANSAKLEQVQDGSPKQVAEQPVASQSGLSSLLSAASYDQPISKVADDEDDDGDSLGGAISDALDKLLSAGQEEQQQSVATSKTAATSFADEPAFAPLSDSTSNMPPPGRLEAFASTSNQVEVDTPLTQTQANKVDALSRLLEVASKAPHKSPDDKRTPSDSASKIAAEINKPPGKVSRQVETLKPGDYNQQPNQGEAMSSPFGGSSPFSSPFNSPSSSQTGQASQGQPPLGSGSGSGMANPYDGVSGMPQATVSNDAVSARIAALNRKLEEQNRPPSASAVNIDAMAQIQQQAEAQAQSQQSTVGTGTSPSVNSLSQLPPQVDDSPSTRAELVNRILGSAKISQHGTKMPELPTRTVAEAITPEQTAAIRGGKGNSQSPPRNRARASRMPGIDLRPIIAIVVLLVVIGGGAFFAYQSGMIKFNLPDSKPGSEAKVSIDQMIKNGELDRARELLESKVNSGKITASEGEKLHSIYYQLANKVDDEDPSEAIKLLEKIPSRSKKYKDSQKLLRKLKKKVKKN
jgi:hypothetical protein